MSSEKIDEIEHEDFSNTAASGASLTYPMQVSFLTVFRLAKEWLRLYQE